GSAFCRMRGNPGGAHLAITGSTFCSGGPPRSSVPQAIDLHFSAAQGCMGRAAAVNIFEGTALLFFRTQPPIRLGFPSAERGIAFAAGDDFLAGLDCDRRTGEKATATVTGNEPSSLRLMGSRLIIVWSVDVVYFSVSVGKFDRRENVVALCPGFSPWMTV